MIIFFIFIEGCQYIKLGPDFKKFNPYLDEVFSFFSLMIPEIQEAKFSQF